MPGSQGAAGERNNVGDLEKPRSPKSGGAMEWVNHPHARGIGGREALGSTDSQTERNWTMQPSSIYLQARKDQGR